jgi:ubiquinone/menaquinone biosynthesis C-methylase UbiE
MIIAWPGRDQARPSVPGAPHRRAVPHARGGGFVYSVRMVHRFDSARLHRLNDPEREKMLDPNVLWEGFGVERPGCVVDLGAGTGFFAVRFIPRLARGGTIWACDSDHGMVAWMEEHLTAEQRAHVRPLETRNREIGLPDASADLAYLINVYHELDDAPQVLREVLRILKPGARLAVVDWRKEPMPHGPPAAHRVTTELIRSQMERAGFAGLTEPAKLPFHVFLTGRKKGNR